MVVMQQVFSRNKVHISDLFLIYFVIRFDSGGLPLWKMLYMQMRGWIYEYTVMLSGVDGSERLTDEVAGRR